MRCDSGGPPSGGTQLPGITQTTAYFLLVYTSTAAVTAESVVSMTPDQVILIPVLLPKGILRMRTRTSTIAACFTCRPDNVPGLVQVEGRDHHLSVHQRTNPIAVLPLSGEGLDDLVLQIPS